MLFFSSLSSPLRKKSKQNITQNSCTKIVFPLNVFPYANHYVAIRLLFFEWIFFSFRIHSFSFLLNPFFTFFSIYSEIFCRGDLLHTVQTAKIYNDSKTFVDMKMKQSPESTLNSFKEFMTEHNNSPTRDEIRQFVEVSFTN